MLASRQRHAEHTCPDLWQQGVHQVRCHAGGISIALHEQRVVASPAHERKQHNTMCGVLSTIPTRCSAHALLGAYVMHKLLADLQAEGAQQPEAPHNKNKRRTYKTNSLPVSTADTPVGVDSCQRVRDEGVVQYVPWQLAQLLRQQAAL